MTHVYHTHPHKQTFVGSLSEKSLYWKTHWNEWWEGKRGKKENV